MRIILHWVLLSISVFITSKIIPDIIIDPLWVVFIVGACLTLFNMFIKPVIKILTLPINVITLGLFSLVVNGIVFWYMGMFIDGFDVSFQSALIGALIISIINWLLKKIFHFDL